MPFFKDNPLFYDLNGMTPLMKIILSIGILLLARIIVAIVVAALNRVSARRFGKVSERKKATVFMALRGVLRFTIYFIALTFILQLFGINTASVLATAGIGGIAIAFGAQSIIADIITGSFLLLEDRLDVGDWVVIGDIEGTVTSVGLRRVVIESYSGAVHYIPNSSIKVLSNFQRRPIRADVEISVPYSVDTERLEALVMQVAQSCTSEFDNYTVEPYLIGITDMGPYSYKANIGAQTPAGLQWQEQRRIRRKLLEALQAEGAYGSAANGKDERNA